MVAALTFTAVRVERDGATLLDGVDLTVADRERLVVLGPSGSGKTTLLRTVAGLERVAAGVLRMDGQDVRDVPTRDRDVGLVDQAATLLPHLDVRRNLGFPLRARRLPEAEVRERVDAEVRAFSLRALLHRGPSTLSGGERHEVALARSLVRRVRVLLLDEPFARIDPPRRTELLRALLELQEGYGVTMLVATNDQRTAMVLGQRIAVLRAGRLVQVGTPTELFARPATTFVAGFVGAPPMNLLPGVVRSAPSHAHVEAGPLRLRTVAPVVRASPGREVVVGVRPTDLRPAVEGDRHVVQAVVVHAVTLGPHVEVALDAGSGRRLLAHVPGPPPRTGALLRLAVSPANVHVFDADGTALLHGL